jgi:predicted DNA-binding transcriptional regulator YafY
MRLDRLFAITILLLNRERMSARELADYFEVSVRTIYRDVDAINQAGIPLVSYAGHQGGIAILDCYKLDHQFLNKTDMATLLSTLRGVNTTFPSRDMDLLIEKLVSVFPRPQAGEGSSAMDEIIFDFVPWGLGLKKTALLKTVHQAVHEKRLLKIVYQRIGMDQTERIIEPISLVNKDAVWYVFAYCRLKEAYRTFRISRMECVQLMAEHFEDRGMTYQAYLDQQLKAEQGIVVTMRFAEQARQQVWENFDSDVLKVDEQGRLRAEMSVQKSEWLYAMILSYGEHAEVLAPDWLRDEIEERIGRMGDVYQRKEEPK